MASDTDMALLRQIVQLALEQADKAHAERVTIRVGVLRALLESFEARGSALTPFAELADNLETRDEDDKPIAVRATCGDLRNARAALG